MHSPDAIDQRFGGSLLVDDATTAQSEGLDELVLVVRCGQKDNPGSTAGAAQGRSTAGAAEDQRRNRFPASPTGGHRFTGPTNTLFRTLTDRKVPPFQTAD